MRALFLFPQLPEDPGSRIPWTHLRIARTVALAGHDVRVFGTTALAHPMRVTAFRLLEEAGFSPRILPAKSQGRLRPEIHYRHDVECRLVDVGKCLPGAWDAEHGPAFDAALADEVRQFPPDVVVTMEARTADAKRFERLRVKGARLVLSVTSPARSDLSIFSGFFCQSDWVAERYAEQSGVRPTVLPPPVPAADVTPEKREPVCVLFPFPTRENGMHLLVRLAEQLSVADSDCPILVMTPAGAQNAGRDFLQSGRSAGFDLSQYQNIMLADPAAQTKEIWAAAQVFVAPALGDPPLSLIGEALVNGVPTVISDRIATEQALRNVGLTAALPLDFGMDTREPLPASAVEPWTELVTRLTTDEEFYDAEQARALDAAKAFDPALLAPQYDAFLQSVMEGPISQ